MELVLHQTSTSSVQGSLQLHNVRCVWSAAHTHGACCGSLHRFFCTAALTPTAVSSAPMFCQSTTAEIRTENAAPGLLWGQGAPGRIETCCLGGSCTLESFLGREGRRRAVLVMQVAVTARNSVREGTRIWSTGGAYTLMSSLSLRLCHALLVPCQHAPMSRGTTRMPRLATRRRRGPWQQQQLVSLSVQVSKRDGRERKPGRWEGCTREGAKKVCGGAASLEGRLGGR